MISCSRRPACGIECDAPEFLCIEIARKQDVFADSASHGQARAAGRNLSEVPYSNLIRNPCLYFQSAPMTVRPTEA